MRTVFVDKFPPLPADDGGKIRSAELLRRLAGTGDVVMCAFERPDADVEGFARLGIELRTVPLARTVRTAARGIMRTGSRSAGRFWSPALAATVRQAVTEAETDVLQVEHGTLAPYLGFGAPRLRVLDLHNVDSQLVATAGRMAGHLWGPAAALEVRLLRAAERRYLPRADVVVTVSAADAAWVGPLARETIVCPNGWTPGPPLPPATAPVVAFVALLSWAPNVDAACWFVRDVWPLVRRRCPAARLLLVGKDPTSEVRRLATTDIHVTGTVPDVREHLAKARVAVAPLRSGGGTRLKVLEALDAGRPVVATSTGVSGLDDLVGDGVVVTDTPAAMAAQLSGLLADPEHAAELGQRGRAAVAARYSWPSVLDPLVERVTR